jgi:GH15 family glucan-1,4-alpha-glucosidase
MSLPIENYAMIGNLHTAALVSRGGSIDWLCIPRFDSPACFAALLGTSEHGRWIIAPEAGLKQIRRRYRGQSLVLETTFETDSGEVGVIDFMPFTELERQTEVVRLIEGRKGSVPMSMELTLRFDYGAIVPRMEQTVDGWNAIGERYAVSLRTTIKTSDENSKIVARFTISEGETISFILSSDNLQPSLLEACGGSVLREKSETRWTEWVSRCSYRGKYREQVVRSLITLKALTYGPTGSILAAPTTSLPEQLYGNLNWDYRYCWLRDGSFSLSALLVSGYTEEAAAWRKWLVGVVAGQASRIQTVYGPAGERRLDERELAHLPGYDDTPPVRVGNRAYKQFQLDIYGEILNVIYIAHHYKIAISEDEWRMLCSTLSFLETVWQEPDDGIWESRNGTHHFTESKVSAWVAFDRAIKLAERYNFKAPLAEWRAVRDEIRAEVCEHGFDTRRNTFVQYYGADEVDASLLRLPLVGFLPPNDPRIVGTVKAIQSELTEGGLLKRERKAINSGEGAFLPCNFWLVDCLTAMGRHNQARILYEDLLRLCNDVGLLSEEYDPSKSHMLGNFPQALTHLALVISAFNLLPDQTPMKMMRGDL